MRIGICGPISTEELRPHLHEPATSAPRGLGGSPVNLLVRELLRRGHEVIVVSCDRDVPVGHDVVLDGPRLRIRYGPYRPRHRARDAFRVERGYVAEALRREQPDIVHAHWTYEFALGALASDRPTLVTCHDWGPAVLRYLPDAYRTVRLGMQIATLTKGRFFTAVSPYIERCVGRFTKGSIAVVPNGLEDSSFQGRARRRGERPTLVAINSGFSRLKNVTTLLRAYGQMRQRQREFRLLLIGDGYQKGGPAHAWARRHGLAEGIEFRGPVPYAHIGEVLAVTDVLVHPSREESFGMVLVEAMARGVPVVGGNHSGAVPWVLGHGSAGVLTDVTSPDELATAVEWLINDASRWLHYSRAGRERAEAEFRANRVAALYEQQYARVLETDAA
jgi:glycosyltransferase involved in cell wall biosynthesis